MVDEIQVTDVTTWRKKRQEGELVTLPSGLVVRRRRVHILDLAVQGKIPAPLVTLAAEMVSATRRKLDLDGMQRYADVVNLVVKAAMVEPPVGDEATEAQLAVDEMEMLDRLAIFNDGNVPTRPLRIFRPEQTQSVATP
jgi:hypothetical protein